MIRDDEKKDWKCVRVYMYVCVCVCGVCACNVGSLQTGNRQRLTPSGNAGIILSLNAGEKISTSKERRSKLQLKIRSKTQLLSLSCGVCCAKHEKWFAAASV